MISLVLPYWERPQAARAALESLARCYASLTLLDLEVIVVDDGSPVPFKVPQGLGDLEIKVLRLPAKAGPKNPCVPFNVGVAEARGEHIALSGVEMVHRKPVLHAMRDRVERMAGEHFTRWEGYVTAACWSDEGRWHAHSSLFPVEIEGVRLPGSYHFLSMLRRELWEAAGGFDEDYREGAGYEDTDFLMRLEDAGASFEQADDLVVEHQRVHARAAWTPAMHERNRQMFRRKWASEMLKC